MDEATDRTRLPLTLRLDEVLDWRGRHHASETAVIYARAPHAGHVLTWADWARRANGVSVALRARGIGRGSVVGVVLQDSPACLAAMFGVWRAGAILVPVDERWGEATADSILMHAMPACVIADRPEAVPGTWITHHPDQLLTFDGLPQQHDAAAPPAGGDIDDIAMIAYTSGTVSMPKGVVLRHRHLRNAYRIARDSLFGRPPARFGHVFRMASLGVFGINYAMPLECGTAVVVLPELGLDTAHMFWREAKQHLVEFVYLVPTLVHVLVRLGHPVEQRRPLLCIAGGAPLSRDLHTQFQERFQHRLRNVYGLTEAAFGILWGADEENWRAAWHLGRPPGGIMLRLRAADGTVSSSISEGLLEVSGPTLADGYWKNEEATRETFVSGWLRTGDIACCDQDGNFSIKGRVKEVVVRGAANIHLDEVDEAIAAHPLVINACAVGRSGPTGIEELGAVVQLKPGHHVPVSELARWCRQRLGPAKTPQAIIVTDQELPRNSAGKVVRAKVAILLDDVTSAVRS